MSKPTPPAKQERGLERQQIVSTALKLLDEVGYSRLTLRRLASALHVQAAALYWHFKNKQDLIDAMAHAIILDEFRKEGTHAEKWQDMLRDAARINRRALRRYHDGAQIMAHANMAHTDMIDAMEYVLSRLRQQGFPPDLAMLSFFTIIRYTLGCVFEEQSDPRNWQDEAARTRHKQALDEMTASHPVTRESIQALAAAIAAGKEFGEVQFEHGLGIIIAGIEQQLDAASEVS